jgi:hypothetical protein
MLDPSAIIANADAHAARACAHATNALDDAEFSESAEFHELRRELRATVA